MTINFFLISILPNVKISLPIFVYENIFFMFYVWLLLVKSAFWITIKASFLLIKLMIQQKSEPLMLKTAISLRLINISSKS